MCWKTNKGAPSLLLLKPGTDIKKRCSFSELSDNIYNAVGTREAVLEPATTIMIRDSSIKTQAGKTTCVGHLFESIRNPSGSHFGIVINIFQYLGPPCDVTWMG